MQWLVGGLAAYARCIAAVCRYCSCDALSLCTPVAMTKQPNCCCSHAALLLFSAAGHPHHHKPMHAGCTSQQTARAQPALQTRQYSGSLVGYSPRAQKLKFCEMFLLVFHRKVVAYLTDARQPYARLAHTTEPLWQSLPVCVGAAKGVSCHVSSCLQMCISVYVRVQHLVALFRCAGFC